MWRSKKFIIVALVAAEVLVGRYRRDEHNAGIGTGENERDRHP